MDPVESTPIACTLTPSAMRDRMEWIAALRRDALRTHARHDLVLTLRFDPAATDRVRELVRQESECCSFLRFLVREDGADVVLTVTAPEHARQAADTLFDQFVGVVAPS